MGDVLGLARLDRMERSGGERKRGEGVSLVVIQEKGSTVGSWGEDRGEGENIGRWGDIRRMKEGVWGSCFHLNYSDRFVNPSHHSNRRVETTCTSGWWYWSRGGGGGEPGLVVQDRPMDLYLWFTFIVSGPYISDGPG